jgi:hypothetical protein
LLHTHTQNMKMSTKQKKKIQTNKIMSQILEEKSIKSGEKNEIKIWALIGWI